MAGTKKCVICSTVAEDNVDPPLCLDHLGKVIAVLKIRQGYATDEEAAEHLGCMPLEIAATREWLREQGMFPNGLDRRSFIW